MSRKALWAAALAVALGHAASRSSACGLCPQVRGGLTVVHPRSLEVALAIRRDLDAKRLADTAAVKDPVRRTCLELQAGRTLAKRLALREGFDLLLIEDGSRYRIERPEHLRLLEQARPPVRWVTSRAVLQALLRQKLDAKTATRHGLLVVEKIPTGRAQGTACARCAVRKGASVVHPKWLQVATALRHGLDSGLLEPVASAADHDRRRSEDLHAARVLAERLSMRDGFELLLIDDGSHYRVEGMQLLRRLRRSAPPPRRWVTGRAVLAALLAGKLDIDQATGRGLLVVEKTSAVTGAAGRGQEPTE